MHTEHTGADPERLDSASLAGQRPILVVDDQPENVALVSRYLESKGHRCITAENGTEALRLASEHQPCLVLLDVMMPGIGGFEVCQRLKAGEDTALIPVILVTALDSKQDRVTGLRAGADEFLSKPVNREELLLRVRTLLRWQRARDDLERQRLEELTASFARYFSPQLVKQIAASPNSAKAALGDRDTRVGAVILFADLRGFTAHSESRKPTDVVAMLNEHFAALTPVVHRYDGCIFNMAGDGLMVGFGVPFVQPDAADRAVACAIEMHAVFQPYSARWSQRHGARIGLGVGAHYGEVVVGNVGGPTYMSYTVIGDTVNVASRLSDIAAPGESVLSERLAMRVSDKAGAITVTQGDSVRLKGREQSVNIYRATATAPPAAAR